MVTNIKKNTSAKDVKFQPNCAVVLKETLNKDNDTNTTFVELGKINKNEILPVFKAAINSIVSDETIINEIKLKFDFVKDEEGNIVTTTAKDGTTTNDVFNTPAVKRLIANFKTDYFLGYTNKDGKFIPLLKVENQNLKSLLCLSPRKIAEIWSKPSANRRAEIHTLAKFALEAAVTVRENEFYNRRQLLEEGATAKANDKQTTNKKPAEKAA